MHLIRGSSGLCMKPQRTLVDAPEIGFCSGVTSTSGLVLASSSYDISVGTLSLVIPLPPCNESQWLDITCVRAMRYLATCV